MNGIAQQSNDANACPANRSGVARAGRAFTLIEVLLSVAIFAILLAAINGLLYAALHLQIHAEDRVDEVLPTGRAVEMIKRDILGIVPMNNGQTNSSSSTNSSDSSDSTSSSDTSTTPTNIIFGPVTGGTYTGTNTLTVAGLSGPIKLDMFTTTGIVADGQRWSEVQRVNYSLQPPVNGSKNAGLDLVRCVSHNPLTFSQEVPDQLRLLANLQEMKVTFYDGTNWLDYWGMPDTYGSTNVPVAIEMTLYYASDRSTSAKAPLKLTFPIPTSLVNTNLY
jgi:prepilin-type N-terminal cleavage/methylation domain-containing protein